MSDDFAKRLVAHFNRPRPNSISAISGIEDWSLNDLMCERSQEIVKVFTTGDDTSGPCPINFGDEYWFKKLCGLAEWVTILEAQLYPSQFEEEEE